MTTSRPNVLLVILDSVRARNTSLHDYPIETTPNLEQLIKEATFYTQARASGIHSIASHASMFSGLHVEEHQIVEHEAELEKSASIWPELASDHGYATGLFTPNTIVAEASNLSEQFEHTVGPKRWRPPDTGLTMHDFDGTVSATAFISEALRHQKPVQSLLNGVRYRLNDRSKHDPWEECGETYISEFGSWTESQAGPWAACINLMDAHWPYEALPEFRSHEEDQLRDLLDFFDGVKSNQILENGGWWALSALETLYNECIKQADAAVGSLISVLQQQGQYDDTLLIITSDHGEAFGEYSQVSPSVRLCDHSWGIHEVQTHVPLVVKEPNQSEGERIQRPASLTEFPDVVRETIRNKEAGSFIPESGSVLSSTYRVPAPGETLPEGVNKSNYIGPWRAVYTESDSGVMKQSTHNDDGVSIRVNSARDSCVESRSPQPEVKDTFSSLSDAEVKQGIGQTNADLEDHLEALGYMR
jgi:arylsulfatase A-like enzyme